MSEYDLDENIDYIKTELKKNWGELNIQFENSVGSTNEILKEWAYENRVEPPFLLLAGEQTAGRGRKNRQWYSPKKAGLYFSLLLKPKVNVQKLYLYTIISALAIRESLVSLNYNAEIKWPNDILLGNKKVAGILSKLITFSPNNSKKRNVVLGIGVNTHICSFPEDLQCKATSMLLEKNTSPDLSFFLVDILKRLANYHRRLDENDETEEIRKKWMDSLNITGKVIQVNTGSQTYSGKVQDISPRGELILDTKKGEKTIKAGDVDVNIAQN